MYLCLSAWKKIECKNINNKNKMNKITDHEKATLIFEIFKNYD